MNINVRSISADERDIVERLYKDYLNELHPERSQLPLEWISNVYNQALAQQRYLWLAHRRCGYGSQLASRVLEEIQQQKVGNIELNVLPENQNAMAFWQNLGFNLRHYTLEMLLSNNQ
jgi:GNAT superfamily N-acetyltransferase